MVDLGEKLAVVLVTGLVYVTGHILVWKMTREKPAGPAQPAPLTGIGRGAA